MVVVVVVGVVVVVRGGTFEDGMKRVDKLGRKHWVSDGIGKGWKAKMGM